MKRVFQIGFNKTATTALYQLFLGCRYKAIHGGGRDWRLMRHPQITEISPQMVMRDNFRAGIDPLTGLEDFTAFFDMEKVDRDQIYEGYRQFKVFHQFHPNAKFLLNVRDVDDWLRSRSRHANGRYIRAYMKHLRTDEDGVREVWRNDFLSHNQAVMEFFADKPDQFLRFDIDKDPISTLIDFCKPDYTLDATKWQRVRVTDTVAAVKDWSV